MRAPVSDASDNVANAPLRKAGLAADPLQQLKDWLGYATRAGIADPTAMTVATSTPDGRPSARILLYKGVYEGGLTFYTNYESRKGDELAVNPRVALVFYWNQLDRQVRVEGPVRKLPPEVSRLYFQLRPRESQIAAVTSKQSSEVASRTSLDECFAGNWRRFETGSVPCPVHWGGYVVMPDLFEFWQAGAGRMHDRLVYRRAEQGWTIVRLQP